MSLTDIQQLHKLAHESKHLLLVFGTEKNDDSIAAALSLKAFFEKQQKYVEVAAEEFASIQRLRFLKGIEEIKPQLSDLQKFIIKVDVSRAKLETLSYEVKDNWLSIFLTPKTGTITKDDLRTAQSDFKFDVIITLGVRDLESLGGIFLNNTDLFYKVPVVNIDYRASNEHFGQVNIVDLTASSTCEVLYKTLQQMGEAFMDEHIATALLTGMISETHSFKNPNVTPYSLNIAGKLMSLGADREKIVKHLYRTRTIAALKLWGQALSHLENERQLGLVWTSLTREDFTRSGGSIEDLHGIIAELISNSPEAKVTVLFHEPKDDGDKRIYGSISAEKPFNALELVQPFNPRGNKKAAAFMVDNKDLKEAENIVLENIRKYLKLQ